MLRQLMRRKVGGPPEQAKAPPPEPVVTAREAERAFAKDAPDVAFLSAREQFYEAFGSPVVERARYFVLASVLGLVVIVLGLTISALLPLKTIQPWVVKVDDTRGTVVLDKGAAQPSGQYKPGRAVLERELFSFVQQLWSMNADYPTLTRSGHEEAYSRTRERAIDEFKDFIAKERVYARLKTESGLVRSVERRSVAFRNEQGIAHVRFATVERTRENHDGTRREWIMLVQFAQRDLTKPEELEKNPLGLFITHFEFNEER